MRRTVIHYPSCTVITMEKLIHSSLRMEITRTFSGMYQIELRDKARLRQGRGILLLTEAEMVELCRLEDSVR